MNRRALITLLGTAAAWPLAARAQPPAMPVIGFLSSVPLIESTDRLSLFRQKLREAGYEDGRNVAVESVSADGRLDRLPDLAAELVRRPVALLVALGTPAARAAKAATTTIPIVFSIGGDPVGLGLVASLSHPGGNATGFTTLGVELGPKRLELLHEVVPRAAMVAHLINPANAVLAETLSRELEAAARRLGVRLHTLHARTEEEIDAAFAALNEMRAGALVIGADTFFNYRGVKLGALTIIHRLPAIYQFREFVTAGGLMSYGGSLSDNFRHLAAYSIRLLKGEKPADLPVQQFTKVELIINLNTANALGLTVPLPLLGRADEVIE